MVDQSEVRPWWEQADGVGWFDRATGKYNDPLYRCERCERTDDALAAIGKRQLCSTCREALDLCTLCASPAMSDEWWCPDCDLAWGAGFDERILI